MKIQNKMPNAMPKDGHLARDENVGLTYLKQKLDPNRHYSPEYAQVCPRISSCLPYSMVEDTLTGKSYMGFGSEHGSWQRDFLDYEYYWGKYPKYSLSWHLSRRVARSVIENHHPDWNWIFDEETYKFDRNKYGGEHDKACELFSNFKKETLRKFEEAFLWRGGGMASATLIFGKKPSLELEFEVSEYPLFRGKKPDVQFLEKFLSEHANGQFDWNLVQFNWVPLRGFPYNNPTGGYAGINKKILQKDSYVIK